MASSRRLDISSLLCDDDQPAFSPLDALVHAATEERRRLDATSYHQQRLREEDIRRQEYERLQRQRDYDQRVREERLRQEMDRQQRERERERELERELERERERERERYVLQQQQQLRLQQQREQERIDLLARQHRQHSLIPSPHPPSISHLISHSPPPPPPQRLPDHLRASPSLPIAHIITPDPISPPSHLHSHQHDPRPVKKRRYSESPTRPITDDKERIAREREKMYVGELGYGRVDPASAGPSYPPPRRPGSGHGHNHPRKPVSVNDLLVDKEPPRPHSRDTDSHRVVSPLGRRSPPGSQIGRAKAARKSDEFTFREPPPIIHTALESDAKKPVKDEFKVKQEPKPRTTSFADEHRPKKLLKEIVAPLPPPPALHKSHSSKSQQDAHEWFLQHYDEDPSPTTSNRPEPPHTPSPSLSPLTPAQSQQPPQPLPPPPVSVKAFIDSDKPLTPITSDVPTLEQELEELVSEPTISNTTTSTVTTTFVKKQEPDLDMDLDVDLAVTELVDTLESDNVKHESSTRKMEVDVEDELLSLVQDDCPPPPPPPVSARRAPGSAGSSSHGSAATPSTTVSTHNANTKPISTTTTLVPLHRSVSEAVRQTSPPVMSASLGPGSVSGGGVSSASAAARQTSARPTSDRGSMPPPASTASVGGPAKKTAERAGSVAPAAPPAKKKKESSAKAAPKPKATSASTTAITKPRAKPAAKSKKGAASENAPSPAAAASPSAAVAVPAPSKAAKTLTGRKTAPSASRSRSASVMPAGSASVGPESDTVKAEKQEEEEDSEEENEDDKDKLYCVCKTKYDEDRVMIACDRCDEWYHTQCVHMPDLEVDLVDQFICPPCVEKNPELNLKTTYKTRCLYGLRHPDPSSSKACHKAARGAFSKYCSDECGVKYMQSRIDTWAKKGGKTEKLWESVKGAEKREGVVVCAAEPEKCVKAEVADVKIEGGDIKPQQQRVVPPKKSKVAQETDRLNALLDSVIKLREEIKKGMEVVIWRERLLKLATERAEAVGQCGWDQRLCLDDEEWADIGEAVLESYEDTKAADADVEMEVDNAEEQWWCPGKVVCDRHAGWQAVRHKDVCKEREKKEEALVKLTTREREIRKSIEDMLDPQNTNNPSTATSATAAKTTTVKETAPNAPLKSSTKAVNGHPKSKGAAAGDTLKKGKKRKAPAS